MEVMDVDGLHVVVRVPFECREVLEMEICVIQFRTSVKT